MTSVPQRLTMEPAEGLVRLAVGGDEAAFAGIVRLHHADMVRVAFVVCGDAVMAEEAVAAAWPLAWRRLASLREPDRLRPWLCSIAANEARQLARRRHRRSVTEIAVPPESVDASSPDPSGRVADLDLAAALARLPPEDRALLALRYVAGLNSTELAHVREVGVRDAGSPRPPPRSPQDGAGRWMTAR